MLQLHSGVFMMFTIN